MGVSLQLGEVVVSCGCVPVSCGGCVPVGCGGCVPVSCGGRVPVSCGRCVPVNYNGRVCRTILYLSFYVL